MPTVLGVPLVRGGYDVICKSTIIQTVFSHDRSRPGRFSGSAIIYRAVITSTFLNSICNYLQHCNLKFVYEAIITETRSSSLFIIQQHEIF